MVELNCYFLGIGKKIKAMSSRIAVITKKIIEKNIS